MTSENEEYREKQQIERILKFKYDFLKDYAICEYLKSGRGAVVVGIQLDGWVGYRYDTLSEIAEEAETCLLTKEVLEEVQKYNPEREMIILAAIAEKQCGGLFLMSWYE
jgi:hypothetical protein